jgi:hypothetical protein
MRASSDPCSSAFGFSACLRRITKTLLGNSVLDGAYCWMVDASQTLPIAKVFLCLALAGPSQQSVLRRNAQRRRSS